MTIQELFKTIDQLSLDDKHRLFDYLRQQMIEANQTGDQKRIFGLHRGAMVLSDDFDAELPDSFWLGEE